MEAIQAQARLIDPGASAFAGGGVSAVLPRAEIERVLADGDYPARLVLDVVKTSGEGQADTAAAVSVSWDERDLNELLRSAGSEGDSMTLWFDRADLERALAAGDVEAHGMRERTAILAIAVAAAGATAGGSFAHPDSAAFAGGTTHAASGQSFLSDVASSNAVSRIAADRTAVQPVSDVASSNAVSRIAADRTAAQPVSDVASSNQVARIAADRTAAQPVSDVASSAAVTRYEANLQAAQPVSDVASSDAVTRYEANLQAAQPVSDVASSDAVSRYQANVEAAQPVSDVASSDAVSRYAANVAADEGDAISRYAANVAADEGDAVSRFQSNAAADAAMPTASVSTGTTWDLSAAQDAALAAGFALLITGAGFVATRGGRRPMRPA